MVSSNPGTPPVSQLVSCPKWSLGWATHQSDHLLQPDEQYTLTLDYGGGVVSAVYMDNISLVAERYSLLDGMVRGNECPVANTASAVGWAGGPINTQNGTLVYRETNLALPVLDGNLAFRQSYASDAVDVYTTTLGYGWTHNYATRLHFTNTTLPDSVELQAPGGSRLPFLEETDGSFPAFLPSWFILRLLT